MLLGDSDALRPALNLWAQLKTPLLKFRLLLQALLVQLAGRRRPQRPLPATINPPGHR